MMDKQLQILHLEDDALDAELVQAHLNAANIRCRITRVQNEREFSNALLHGGYDLILADYRLPSYDGLSALILAREERPHIPFIFVSGTLGEDAAINALTEGAIDYVIKQNLSRLVPAVKRAIAESENKLKRKQAEETLRERELHSQSLLRLSRKLEQAQTYTDVLNAAQDEVREVIGYQSLWAYLLTEDRKFAHALFARGPIEKTVMSEDGTATLSIQGDKMLEEIAEAKAIVVVEDAQTDPRPNKEIVTALGNRTIVNIPIMLFDKHLGSVGTGTFGNEGVRVPTTSEREYLMALASHMAVTLDRIHLLEKRKQMEQELVAREQEYRILVETIPDLIVRYDKDLRRIYVNPAWEKASGLSSREVINAHPADLPRVPSPIHHEYFEKLQWVLQTGEPQAVEFTWVNSYGTPLNLEYVMVPEYDRSGNINGVLSVGRDITERKRAGDALRERERHSQSLLRLSRRLEQAQTYSDVLDAAQQEVRNIIGYQNLWAYLFTPDKSRAEILFAKGPMADNVMSKEGTATISVQGDRMMEEFVETEDILVVEDAQTDERTDKKIAAKMGNRTLVHVPIMLFDRLMGAVGTGTFGDEGLRVPTETEREYLVALASHIAVTFDRIHLFDQRRQSVQALRENEEKFRTLIEQSAEGVILADENGMVVEWNHANERMMGLAREQVLGQPLWEVMLKLIDPQQATADRREAIKSGILKALSGGASPLFHAPLEMEFYPLPGREKRYLHQNIFPIKTDKGYRLASLVEDFTERKKAEAQLLASEQLFRALVENAPDFIARYARDYRRIYINPAIQKLFGGPAESVLGKTPADQSPVYAPQVYMEHLKWVIETATESAVEMPFRTAQGEMRWGHMRFVPEFGPDGKVESVLAIGRDIHEIKENERRFKMLAENFPDLVIRFDRGYRYIYVNPAFEKAFGVSAESVLGKTQQELLQGDKAEWNDNGLIRRAFDENTAIESVAQWNTVTGERVFETRYVPEKDPTGNVTTVLCIARDITERKRMEEALAEQEREFRTLAEYSPDNIARYDIHGKTIYVNPTMEKTLGRPASEMLGTYPAQAGFIKEGSEYQEKINTVLSTGKEQEMDLVLPDTGTGVRHHNIRFVAERGADGTITGIQAIGRDITERKRHELEQEAILTVSASLRQASTRAEIISIILDKILELFEADGAVMVLPDLLNGGYIDEMGRGPVGERMVGLNIPPGKGACDWVIKNKKPYLNNQAQNDPLFYRPDLLGDSNCLATVPLITHEHVIGAIWIARKKEISDSDLRLFNAIADLAANAIHRITLHERTERQLHHLLALHQIDVAITTSFDLDTTLDIILTFVRSELEVDSASVLLLNTSTNLLEYAAGLGFKTDNIKRSSVEIGDGFSGRAALELRTVSCPDLKLYPGFFSRSSLLVEENFASHFATPLLVQGKLKGVLEVFHRVPYEPNPEWIAYFETLATQAALAIQNYSLLQNLQQSNRDLTHAYDATIEGWSRALDLRDRETEGHTRRVTEMVLELADRLGISSEEKADIKRGALLHDIGKMGVPDSILHKPGPLTDDERTIMRKHPSYAFQMLSPIPYLKYALDIPYCHHEKWDGSGYPRGLKEDEIPLSARMFAVVDVFDALTSDRPYRKAWTHEETRRYIESQAGVHFDSQIVEVFIEIERSKTKY